jgi:hypothetical protein
MKWEEMWMLEGGGGVVGIDVFVWAGWIVCGYTIYGAVYVYVYYSRIVG